MSCWFCGSEGHDKQCWVCGGKPSENMADQGEQGETVAEQERESENIVDATNGPSTRTSFSKGERLMDDADSELERPAPTYLAPYTRSSAAPSVRSTTPLIARYPSDVCDFDFSDQGGPIISFIRSSGISSIPRTADDNPRFGSIEIVRSNKER
jgi:hypothetical protein